MLRDLVAAVKDAYSGPTAKQHVAALSQYHRVQASPGYRAAAQYCLGQLRSWGLRAEIVSFPADGRTSYWTCRMFQEWDASQATLDLVQADGSLRRLADYREDRIALIQRSLPFEGEVEVAVLEWGAAEEDYRGVDVAGKVVLAQGDIHEIYRLAVEERGAVGILFDGMRESPPVRQRIDLPDARQYTSFWWRQGDEPRCFGFVLTPRQGDQLRLAARRRGEGQAPLRMRARVVSRLYDGQMEVVSALIPGQSDEEALLIAHLCHPQPSANDNASGAGALLEAARALQELIAAGRLPRPRRSIRLLWVPEMTGTYAYLATHEDELARMVAGLNLDMVGQNQALCQSSFLIERPPEALPSFAGDLAEALREALQGGARPLGGADSYPLYRQGVTPYSGGSDHCILSDPTVGVPTPMLIQWPDRFYHTSEDTLDKVDAGMLAVAGRLAAAYAYFVAAAGDAEVRWLAREMAARTRGRLAALAQEFYTRAMEAAAPEEVAELAQRAARGLAFCAGRATEGLATLTRLAACQTGREEAIEEAGQAIRAAQEQEWLALQKDLSQRVLALGRRLPPAPGPAADEWTPRAGQMVLRRLFRGPVALSDLETSLEAADRGALRSLLQARGEAGHGLADMMIYWIDGRRSLGEVADLVECETGKRDVEFMVRLAGLLERAGLLESVVG